MEEVRVRRRVIISGVVQGVWFRASAARAAEALGVDGWVRNLPDGRVEAVLEGPPDAVNRAVAWMREGPPSARVDAVEIIEEPVREERGFRIR